MSTRLTRKGFEAWLSDQHPNTLAGFACQANSCPIAWFLKVVLHREVLLDRHTCLDLASGRETKLPIWAQRFVECIDSEFNGRVTAAQALKVLEDIK